MDGDAAPKVRVVLVGLPRMLSEIVHALARDQQDIELVADVDGDADLVTTIDRTKAGLLLCAEEPEQASERWADLLRRRPPPAILNLAEGGRSARLFDLKPLSSELGHLSADALLNEIRLRGRLGTG